MAKENRGWCETTISEINAKNYLKVWTGLTSICEARVNICLAGALLSCELWPTNTLVQQLVEFIFLS